MSDLVQLALLIVVLYASTCVSFLYANEGILERTWSGFRVRVAGDQIRVRGRSPTLLNPFTPMFPAFRARWGMRQQEGEVREIPSEIRDVMLASSKLELYVIAVFLYVVIAIPTSLLVIGVGAAAPVAVLAYIAVTALLVRLWFLREKFALNRRKFAVVALECVLCPPFAAGVVRRLSLPIAVSEDLVSVAQTIPEADVAQTVDLVMRRCAEYAGYYEVGSPDQLRLAEYSATLQAKIYGLARGCAVVTPDDNSGAESSPATSTSGTKPGDRA